MSLLLPSIVYVCTCVRGVRSSFSDALQDAMARATTAWFQSSEWRFASFTVRPESINIIWTEREKAWYVKLELDVATPKDFPVRSPHISVAYGVQLPDKGSVAKLLMELRSMTPPMRLSTHLTQRHQKNYTIDEESELWKFVEALRITVSNRHHGDPVEDMFGEAHLAWRWVLVDTYCPSSSLAAPTNKGGGKGARHKAWRGRELL